LVFVDTPGIFSPKGKLEKSIVSEAKAVFDQVDLICVVMDIRRATHPDLEVIKDLAKRSKKKCYAIINKIDLVDRQDLMTALQEVYNTGVFEEVFPISALKSQGTKHLLDFLIKSAPLGDWHYQDDEVTDQPERKLAEEITREQAYILLHEELPYSLKIETDLWEDQDNGSVKIYHSIFINKVTQKSIVLGKNGSKIKEIGKRARMEISKLLGRKVHLYLHVKIRENWIDQDH
jgi:GTP-binding protein Era